MISPDGHLALAHCFCSTSHEITRSTSGHVYLPQEQSQQGLSAYPDMSAHQGFHRLWAEQQPAKLQEIQSMDARQDTSTAESLTGWWLWSSPWDEGRHSELTPGGGTASSEGLQPLRDCRTLGVARNVQKAFRGRWPPSKALLGEDSSVCPRAGIRARGRKSSSCFLSSHAFSVVFL